MNTAWIDLVLAVTMAEGLALLGHRRMTGRGVPAGITLPFLGAGAAMLLAMRLLATGGGFAPVASLLVVSGVLQAIALRAIAQGVSASSEAAGRAARTPSGSPDRMP